jgi:hypothetical protein
MVLQESMHCMNLLRVGRLVLLWEMEGMLLSLECGDLRLTKRKRLLVGSTIVSECAFSGKRCNDAGRRMK